MARGIRWIAAGAGLALLAIGWLAMAPVQLGGTKSYVVIEGQSMEPKFHRGDLVVLTSAPSYSEGEVVGYHSKKLGHAVLHRIVDRDGGRYVFKGDNNTWIDSERPDGDRLIGRLWVHVPGAGKYVTGLGQPRNAALFAGFMTLFVGGVSGKRARRRKGRHIEAKDLTMRNGRSTDRQVASVPAAPIQLASGALTGLGLLAVLCLVLGVMAFGRPVEKAEATSLPYTQTATFDYTAEAPSGPVYDGDKIEAGDPVFLRLVDSIDVSFDYALTSNSPVDVEGTASLSLRLSDVNGWNRTLPLAGEAPLENGRVHIEDAVDLGSIRTLVNNVERRTGVERDVYTLSIEPFVQTTGTVAGERISETFSKPLAFEIDDLAVQLRTETPGAEADSDKLLQQSTSGEVAGSQIVPNVLSFPGPDLSVATARRMALAGGAASLVLLLALAAYVYLLRRSGEPNRIAARYGHMMVSVARQSFRADAVDVVSIDDLAGIAVSGGRMILHEEHEGLHTYYVEDSGVTYRYRTGEEGATAGSQMPPVPPPSEVAGSDAGKSA